MCYQHGIFPTAESVKLPQRLFFQRCVSHHLVGNTSQLCDFFGDGALGVDKNIKGVQYLPVFQLHRTDFCDPVVPSRKAGSLQIKNDVGTHQRHILFSVDNRDHIVDKVAFHPINNLEIPTGFGDCRRGAAASGNACTTP